MSGRAEERARPAHPDIAFRRAAGLFRAIGDVERLRLLAQLADGERCVSELAAGTAMSTVSQRLRILLAEELIDRRRDGKHVFYRLADAHVAALVHSALAHVIEPDHRHEEEPS